jgi:hypothetical protein
MKSFVAVLRLKRLLLASPFFVSVLCVLCAFVVKIRYSLPSFIVHRSSFPVAPLHRSGMIPPRKSTISCLLGARYSHNVGHQNRPFSALHASPISVDSFPPHDMHIFDVIKCNYLYRQPAPSPLWHPAKQFKRGEMWGSSTRSVTLAVISHPASRIPYPISRIRFLASFFVSSYAILPCRTRTVPDVV